MLAFAALAVGGQFGSGVASAEDRGGAVDPGHVAFGLDMVDPAYAGYDPARHGFINRSQAFVGGLYPGTPPVASSHVHALENIAVYQEEGASRLSYLASAWNSFVDTLESLSVSLNLMGCSGRCGDATLGYTPSTGQVTVSLGSGPGGFGLRGGAFVNTSPQTLGPYEKVALDQLELTYHPVTHDFMGGALQVAPGPFGPGIAYGPGSLGVGLTGGAVSGVVTGYTWDLGNVPAIPMPSRIEEPYYETYLPDYDPTLDSYDGYLDDGYLDTEPGWADIGSMAMESDAIDPTGLDFSEESYGGYDSSVDGFGEYSGLSGINESDWADLSSMADSSSAVDATGVDYSGDSYGNYGSSDSGGSDMAGGDAGGGWADVGSVADSSSAVDATGADYSGDSYSSYGSGSYDSGGSDMAGGDTGGGGWADVGSMADSSSAVDATGADYSSDSYSSYDSGSYGSGSYDSGSYDSAGYDSGGYDSGGYGGYDSGSAIV